MKTSDEVMQEIRQARALEDAWRKKRDAESDRFMENLMNAGLVDDVIPSHPKPLPPISIKCMFCGTARPDMLEACPSCGEYGCIVRHIGGVR